MTVRELLQSVSHPYTGHKSRTVRYAFPLVFLFAALLGASTITSNTQSSIKIVASQQSVRAGDTFQIKVYVEAQVPVNAVDLTLSFPSDQVAVTGIDTGESVITLWTQPPQVLGNSVTLRGGTFRKGFVGEHLIATINATANQTGIATFAVTNETLLAGDGSGSKVTMATDANNTARLYIANKDGTFTLTDSSVAGVQGQVQVHIITDIDGDGKVTLADVSRFMGAWGSTTQIYDFNGDNKMNFTDFGIILADSFLGAFKI